MKTQKIILSAVLVFAGILVFAKTQSVSFFKKDPAADSTTKTEVIKAVSTLKVVWLDKKGRENAGKTETRKHQVLTKMPFASKEQFTYDFENKTLIRKGKVISSLKKVWKYQPDVQITSAY